MRRSLLLVLLMLLGLPAAARADGSRLDPVEVPAVDLADATNLTTPTAAAGHVVFSRYVPALRRYELVAWSAAGGVRALPVGDRAVPFDADAGTNVRGHPVVTFSRCATDGTMAPVLPTVDFTGARGCRPWIASLTSGSGSLRPLRLARAAGLSLTTPSMWRGGVVAVAAPARGSHDARVLYWKRRDRAPVRLRGGSAPDCPFGKGQCRRTVPRTGVDALDLGPRSVAFLWRMTDPPFGAGPGIELRSSTLRPGGPGRRLGVATGYLSGACGFRQPLSPAATARGGIGFVLAQSPCDVLQTSLALQRTSRSTVLGARPADVMAYGAAFDGREVYWLRGAPPSRTLTATEPAPVPCARADASCRLVRSRDLPLAPLSKRR